MITVAMADDNRGLRRGLRLRLERANGIAVVGETASHVGIVKLCRARKVQVALLDARLPGGDLLATVRALSEPPMGHTAVLVLADKYHDAHAISAFDAGASGFLVKGADTMDLIGTVQTAARGRAIVTASAATVLVTELLRRKKLLWGEAASHDAAAQLSAAELSVVSQLSRGRSSNEAIAANLHLSVNTVRTQLQSCLRKTGLADRTQLALWGVQLGLDRLATTPRITKMPTGIAE